MSQAVICDNCGKVLRLQEAVIVDILRLGKNVVHNGHLCKDCTGAYKVESSGMEVMMTKKNDPSELYQKYRYKVRGVNG